VVLGILVAIWAIISYYWTDYLWYQEMGQTDIFWTPFLGRLLVGLFFGVLFFAILYGSVWTARKLSPDFKPVQGDPSGNVIELITRRRWPGYALLLVSAVIAILVGVSYGGRWEQVLLFLNRQEFGVSDPMFGKDASFFVYTLPLLTMLVNFVITAAVVTGIFTFLVYLGDRAFTIGKKNLPKLAPRVWMHLSVLVAVLMLAKAAEFALGRWGLVYSERGFTLGANYTDVNVVLPMLSVLAVVSLVAVVILLANSFFRGWKLPAIAIGLVILVWLVGGKIVPAAVQSLSVSPDQEAKDSVYITRNIESTRWAFGIDDISRASSAATLDLTGEEVAMNLATTENIRIWEPRPAKAAYTQQQTLKPYYAFNDVDVDRYVLDGELRQVLISARELDPNRIVGSERNWVTEHLKYTHGYGFVLSPVNKAGDAGGPDFLVKDIPPVNTSGLEITRPQIYYGELGNNYVIVGTRTLELDYPEGDTDVTTTYEGDSGIEVGGFFKRMAFTLRLGSLSILTSDSVNEDSRIMFRRTLEERVMALAPFLAYDYDPYLVLREDGSLVYMWDAYSTTSLYPYSQPWNESGVNTPNYIPRGTNFIRNSVKVVMDAYTGDVAFYQVEPDDAIVNTWGEIYPDLFTPADQMPADIKSHMRYPENLYNVQADVLTQYHVTDAAVFYNRQDEWEIPTEIYDESETPTTPYYQVLALPGETESESALLTPFAPQNKANMVGLLAARQDGDNYGQLLLLEFPKGTPPDGPALVEAKISNDSAISEQITLWDQAGSNVIRGNLLVIPIEDSVVYFEPLYLQASIERTIPELRRVIVVYGSTVVMEPTVTDALVRIFGEEATGTSTTPTTQPGETTTTTAPAETTTTTVGGTVLPTDMYELIQQAEQYYNDALAAQQRGDWAEYGRLIDLLGDVLDRLAELQ